VGSPAEKGHSDGGKGTGTGLEESSKKSKTSLVGVGISVAKGKEVSSNMTWREIMVRLV
jgi:hypothetical protein